MANDDFLSPRNEGLNFDWDEANISHIARHAVTPEEAEQVLLGDAIEQDFDEEDDEPRWTYVGETISGRILEVVIAIRSETMRVVTAFEPVRRIQQIYLQAKADRR
jgi:hypothetical protein